MEKKLHGDSFDKNNHMSCPKCGFEVVYLNADNQTSSYVFQDGKVDIDSEEDELDLITHDEHGLTICNSIYCGWEMIAG